ncbi:uncharacterized protein LOC108910734 [Anoplophora glabripennis]|uniref:uncharacterized protein LOC108910734 n=1 Tax=Anoplophora glabripennis TaxID=217634 RepID=UPI000874A176|nr:uncharacterized protein LOC108910734 [Anoplophora glabripennis]
MDKGENNLSTHVVLKLCEDYLDSGRTDNFYTHIPLANQLLKRKTHNIGTLRKSRKYLPKDIVTAKLSRGEVIGQENKDGIVVAKWRDDKRDVLVLSTHHTLEIVNTGKKNRKQEDIKKPKFIINYNAGKAGIDLSDQLSSYSSPMRKSIR